MEHDRVNESAGKCDSKVKGLLGKCSASTFGAPYGLRPSRAKTAVSRGENKTYNLLILLCWN